MSLRNLLMHLVESLVMLVRESATPGVTFQFAPVALGSVLAGSSNILWLMRISSCVRNWLCFKHGWARAQARVEKSTAENLGARQRALGPLLSAREDRTRGMQESSACTPPALLASAQLRPRRRLLEYLPRFLTAVRIKRTQTPPAINASQACLSQMATPAAH